MAALGLYILPMIGNFCLSSCRAFSPVQQYSVSKRSQNRQLRESDSFKKFTSTILSLFDESDENDGETTSSSLPALGPAGTSSNFASGDTSYEMTDTNVAAATTTVDDDGNTESKNSIATFVNPKFALQYTCNVCDTKNRVIVSRRAYREGMVIAVCKGCNNKHWIADNLDPTLSHNNIEEYFESCGKGDTVNRVTEEVYEIERVFGLKEGEITDESGDVVLE